MPYHLSLTLEGLPRMQNPSGRKSHWRVIKQERDHWKRYLSLLIHDHKCVRPHAPLKKARLRLTRFSSLCPDPDGLVSGFKAIVDGLVFAGILENDRMENIGMPDYRWEKAPRGQGRVKIEVWET